MARKDLLAKLDPGAGPKRILSLDGGGVKGVLTLGLLEGLEAELRRRSGDPGLVLSDYFELIGGTSTGAIIAAGLALGKSVGELIEMYLELGPKVFGRASGDGLVLNAKYDERELEKALKPVLGRRTLGSPDLRTFLALHMKRIDTGSAWVLTNNPNNPFFDPPDSEHTPNKSYRLADLVRASAAAPTFFKEVEIVIARDEKDRPTQTGYFVDGAVGGFNNPSLQLLLTALVPAYGFGWRAGAKTLMMASFGTGHRRPELDGRVYKSRSPGWRGVQALRSMIFDTQMQAVLAMQALSVSARPWRINSEVGDLAGVCISPTPMLDYQRIDVRLERKPKPKRGEKLARTAIEELLDRELDHKVLESVDQLANGDPANMQLLLEIGRRAAPAYVDAQWPAPDFDLPEWRGPPPTA